MGNLRISCFCVYDERLVDEQVLKLKEVEEIYQELFQTELNDCGEVIEGLYWHTYITHT